MLTASCSGVVPTTSTAVRDGRFGTSADRTVGAPTAVVDAGAVVGARRIEVDAELVQRPQDLGVAAQQPGDEQREQREHHCEQGDQDRHPQDTLAN